MLVLTGKVQESVNAILETSTVEIMAVDEFLKKVPSPCSLLSV